MKIRRIPLWAWAFLAFFAAALVLRAAGIMWGLPDTFNGDEPHLVNLALSFGGGSLRPYAFKYPTLWPYLLFFSYGIYFLIWSGFGLRHGVEAFAGLYAWHPTGFYLIGRVLSAAAGLLGALAVLKMERESSRRPWGAILLLFSPVIVELSHSCKPDCLMFFFAALAWLFALRIYRGGGRREHWLCGAFFGLAFSSQYTVLPAALALPLAHFFSRRRRPLRSLAEGLACVPAAFLAGSPYALLDYKNFRKWTSMYAPRALALRGTWSRLGIFKAVLGNIWHFAGPGLVPGAALLAGLAIVLRKDWKLAGLLTLPVLAYIPFLINNPDGAWQRYLLGIFPALAFLASDAFEALAAASRPWLAAAVFAAALFPGAARCVAMDKTMRLPDTRQLAQAWIERNIPQGSALLLDEANDSPRLIMAKDEAEELAERTKAEGSPRWRLYRAMADYQPGGGYWIYRIKRSAESLGTYPLQVALSQADAPIVDARGGLAAVRKAGVDYVVTSSMGATPERSPGLAAYFRQLQKQGILVARFDPAPGQIAGPVLRVYRIRLGASRGRGARPRAF
ncbi:MAG TPA: glycosyltransferase family 39 protein [Elusimicrobiota bacterium]|nr:glycosyltransferase family 39 protein [Elusimicrobiota bacterium]